MAKDTKVKATVRKAIGSGGSLLLTLPKEFCRRNGLTQGSELALIFDREMVIRPWIINNVPRKEKDGE